MPPPVSCGGACAGGGAGVQGGAGRSAPRGGRPGSGPRAAVPGLHRAAAAGGGEGPRAGGQGRPHAVPALGQCGCGAGSPCPRRPARAARQGGQGAGGALPVPAALWAGAGRWPPGASGPRTGRRERAGGAARGAFQPARAAPVPCVQRGAARAQAARAVAAWGRHLRCPPPRQRGRPGACLAGRAGAARAARGARLPLRREGSGAGLGGARLAGGCPRARGRLLGRRRGWRSGHAYPAPQPARCGSCVRRPPPWLPGSRLQRVLEAPAQGRLAAVRCRLPRPAPLCACLAARHVRVGGAARRAGGRCTPGVSTAPWPGGVACAPGPAAARPG